MPNSIRTNTKIKLDQSIDHLTKAFDALCAIPETYEDAHPEICYAVVILLESIQNAKDLAEKINKEI